MGVTIGRYTLWIATFGVTLLGDTLGMTLLTLLVWHPLTVTLVAGSWSDKHSGRDAFDTLVSICQRHCCKGTLLHDILGMTLLLQTCPIHRGYDASEVKPLQDKNLWSETLCTTLLIWWFWCEALVRHTWHDSFWVAPLVWNSSSNALEMTPLYYNMAFLIVLDRSWSFLKWTLF